MFSRYLAASAVSLGLDYLVLAALVYGLGAAGPAAAATGYCAGALVHYAISRRFVFPSGWMHGRRWAEFSGFLASGLLGLLLTVAIVYVGSTLLGLALPLSKTVAVAMSFAATYLLRRRLVFRQESAATSPAEGPRLRSR